MRGARGFLLLAVTGLTAGCGKTTTTSGSAAPARPQAHAAASSGGTPAAAQQSLRRTIQRQGVAGELKQVALYYQDYNTTFGRAPAKLDDLKPSMVKEASKLYQALQEGYYVVIWNVNSFSPNTLLAYEKDADEHQMRFVVHGDGSVQKMNPEDLKAALQQR